MLGITSTNYSKPHNIPSFGGKIPQFKQFGDLSPAFIKEMNEGVREYPGRLFQKLLKKLKLKLRLGPDCSDAFPDHPDIQQELRTQFCPGSEDIMYEVFYGYSTKLPNNNHVIALAERPELVPCATKRGVSHELTHKINELLEDIIGVPISSLQGFKDAVRESLIKLPERKKLYPKLFKQYNQQNFDYLTQGSTPENIDLYALEEIFSDSGSALTTRNTRDPYDKISIKFMKTFFPEPLEYVRKVFYLFGMR